MITRARTTNGVKLTFSLDLDRPVSVIGDFNGWDPAAHPLKPRTNGKRSAVVTVPPGGRHAFRYLAEGGHFFDDAQADGYEDNGYGGTHGVVVLETVRRTGPAARASAASSRVAPAPKSKARAKSAAAGPAAAARPAVAKKASKPKG